MKALLRSFLALFLPTPKPEEVLTPEERARVDRAWDEVFARMAERRKEMNNENACTS
jgi:hypothetical protein